MVYVAQQQRDRFAIAHHCVHRGLGGVIECLAVGDVGQGIGQAFLAHIVQLVAQLAHLGRRGLQFALQRLGPLFHGARCADQPFHQLADVGGAAIPAQLARRGRQGVGIGGSLLAGFGQPAQHVVNHRAHVAAQRLHRQCGAGARQAAQAQILQHLRCEGFSGVDQRRHHLAHSRVLARGIGIEKFEIVGRGHDVALTHQGKCSFCKALFAVRLEHSRQSPGPGCPGSGQSGCPPGKKGLNSGHFQA